MHLFSSCAVVFAAQDRIICHVINKWHRTRHPRGHRLSRDSRASIVVVSLTHLHCAVVCHVFNLAASLADNLTLLASRASSELVLNSCLLDVFIICPERVLVAAGIGEGDGGITRSSHSLPLAAIELKVAHQLVFSCNMLAKLLAQPRRLACYHQVLVSYPCGVVLQRLAIDHPAAQSNAIAIAQHHTIGIGHCPIGEELTVDLRPHFTLRHRTADLR